MCQSPFAHCHYYFSNDSPPPRVFSSGHTSVLTGGEGKTQMLRRQVFECINRAAGGARGGGASVTKYGWSKIPHWSWFPTSTRVCLTKVICVQSVVRLIEQFVTSLCANTGSDPAPYSSASGAALCEKFNEAHQSGFLLEVFRELRFKYPCMHLNDNKTPSMTNAFLKMRNTVVRSVLVPI